MKFKIIYFENKDQDTATPFVIPAYHADDILESIQDNPNSPSALMIEETDICGLQPTPDDEKATPATHIEIELKGGETLTFAFRPEDYEQVLTHLKSVNHGQVYTAIDLGDIYVVLESWLVEAIVKHLETNFHQYYQDQQRALGKDPDALPPTLQLLGREIPEA